MKDSIRSMLWSQFGAAIDMLENAIIACPDELWGTEREHQEFWYIAYHALFFLDCYLSESLDAFTPPPPFTLDELDERGLLPERIYSRGELREYLAHGRDKCRRTIAVLTEAQMDRACGFDWLALTFGELLLYNMRHVQHHAAQLNLLLSRQTGAAPRWVRQAKGPTSDE